MLKSKLVAVWDTGGRFGLQMGQKEYFGGDGNVLYLNCGIGFIGIYVC